MPQTSRTLRAADLASLAAATVDANPSQGMTARVGSAEGVLLTVYATGHAAGAVGVVDFDFVVSPDGLIFDTTPFVTISLTLSGITTVQKSQYVSLAGAHSLQWSRVENKDAAVAADNINAVAGVLWKPG